MLLYTENNSELSAYEKNQIRLKLFCHTLFSNIETFRTYSLDLYAQQYKGFDADQKDCFNLNLGVIFKVFLFSTWT